MAEEEQTETKSEGIENLKVLENIDIKPLPEKSPILTKKVSNITEDL